MTENPKMCFTCRKSDCNKFYNAQNCDSDKISYLDKLKSCVSTDLIEDDNMEMCWLCVKHLRISYKFRATVLMSQEVLRKNEELSVDLIKKEADCEDIKVYINSSEANYMKSESDSDTDCFGKSDYSSDDSSCKDIIDTVNSLTKKIEKKRAKRKYNQKSKDDALLSCEYCGTQFSKQWQLKKHIARVHNEIRKFMCTYCNKEFKQSYHLKEHITSHTGEKNYSCPICDKKFQRLSSQRRHIKSHDAPPGHKTKRTPFLCTICGKSFPFSNGVQRHMRIHLGIKNFECSLCNRRFTQSTHLQVHMRTHTGEKPYICDTCGEKFSLKSCMLKHINNRHYGSKNLAEELPIFYLHKDFDQA
ncbi:zf-H2C2 2 domain containing protein [Asbolus verrucosus]|uniref:Zf-H2C2 2 domain containing protein n=1 Tax=Asbolus verrucosus TaxID=1661398 RepID=A0A482VCE2_ASBVE|nr:zf-H2C2 2 domain containing protein [Asbolus verrucosus]